MPRRYIAIHKTPEIHACENLNLYAEASDARKYCPGTYDIEYVRDFTAKHIKHIKHRITKFTPVDDNNQLGD